jgi:heavy-metal resistance protein
MLGFVFGTLCLVGFVGVLRHRGLGRFGHHGRRFGRSGLYRLFQELDTSPGQEKAIRGAVLELRRSLGELRPRFDAARSQVANALRGDSFDALGVEASLEGQTRELGRAGSALTATLAKVHEALDPDQRRRLARFVEMGPAYACL